ncbi:hypothetical protein QUF74_01560 [Candidatus Halobeggiatoa sp. HSG11]|nr:hypothetical protein [Candidatus Halobeggiatoa sp. HSG11]
MTDYKITLSPDLEINSADFVTAWNDTCQEVAKARLETSTAVDYDPLLAGVAAVFISGIAVGMTTNALYDVVKQVVLKQAPVQKLLEKRGWQKNTEVIEIKTIQQADGTPLLVVVLKEN